MQLSRELGVNPKTVAKRRKRATVEDMTIRPTKPRLAELVFSFLSPPRPLKRIGQTKAYTPVFGGSLQDIGKALRGINALACHAEGKAHRPVDQRGRRDQLGLEPRFSLARQRRPHRPLPGKDLAQDQFAIAMDPVRLPFCHPLIEGLQRLAVRFLALSQDIGRGQAGELAFVKRLMDDLVVQVPVVR